MFVLSVDQTRIEIGSGYQAPLFRSWAPKFLFTQALGQRMGESQSIIQSLCLTW